MMSASTLACPILIGHVHRKMDPANIFRRATHWSWAMEGSAKTEGKIEGDGTFVRRSVCLHEGWSGTARIGRVLWMPAISQEHGRLCVLSAPACERMRRSCPDV